MESGELYITSGVLRSQRQALGVELVGPVVGLVRNECNWGIWREI